MDNTKRNTVRITERMGLFTVTEHGFATELSDLEANIHGKMILQSGKEFASLTEFMDECIPHYIKDADHELSFWTYHIDEKTITIFND